MDEGVVGGGLQGWLQGQAWWWKCTYHFEENLVRFILNIELLQTVLIDFEMSFEFLRLSVFESKNRN